LRVLKQSTTHFVPLYFICGQPCQVQELVGGLGTRHSDNARDACDARDTLGRSTSQSQDGRIPRNRKDMW
jgi:hypothetical protein